MNKNITVVCPPGIEEKRIADALIRELESYRVPRDVAKRVGKRSVEDITEPWLIVVCTPDTPPDPAINGEIDRFIGLGLYTHILTLLDSDRPEKSFPPQLLSFVRADGTVEAREPLAANIHAPSFGEKTRRLKVEKLRLLAPMFSVAFDDLMNRRRRARDRVLAAIGAAAVMGGCVFLASALTRKSALSKQNRELSGLYLEAEVAREEAETQRARARAEYVKTVALSARRDADHGDTEAALIGCLDYLPEMKDIPELTDAFGYILGQYCDERYVPVGSAYDYRLTRGLGTDASDAYHRTDDLYGEEDYTLLIPPPEDLDAGEGLIAMKLCARSPSGDVSVYDHGNGRLLRVVFGAEPERDHYLRDVSGNLVEYDGLSEVSRDGHTELFYTCCFADDDTLLFLKDGALWRADLSGGSISRLTEGDAPGYRLLLTYPGTDAVFAFTESGADVWDRGALTRVDVIEGLEDIVARGDCDVLLGWRSGRLEVCRKSPFACLYGIDRDGGSGKDALSTDIDTVYLPDGRAALMYGSVLYDLSDGSVIFDYRDETTQSPRISSEGYVLTTGYQSVSVWDPVSGRRLCSIRGCLSDGLGDSPAFQPYGPIDPGTGRRGVSAVLIGSRVYEYRSFRELPSSLEGRIALAEEILDARGLLPAVVMFADE